MTMGMLFPEDILYDKCCEVLQLDEFDNEIFQSEIEQISVPKPNVLTFIFKDGHKQTVHRSFTLGSMDT